ncbi:MAG: hypothetical protein HYV90_04410 [Candidatus Woesebacteria bacterium]|nr:MAG: hypothetical protein HYV90_04410 [Candidatus Woesebacteria bacterium]
MNYLSPEAKFSYTDLFPQYISLEKALGPHNLKAFSFTSGEQLLPFKEMLNPKFQKLWASALSRSSTDNLVIEDSSEYPYLPTDKVIIIKNSQGEIPVFFSYRDVATTDSRGLYLHICLVDKKYQGMGLMRALTKYVIDEAPSTLRSGYLLPSFVGSGIPPKRNSSLPSESSRSGYFAKGDKTKPGFISLMTQNEHMVQTLRPFCPPGSLYPIDGKPPEEILAIANNLIPHESNFDKNTFVWKRVYSNGSPLYGDRMERHSNHPEIRNYFEKNINFQDGDAVLIVGKLK